MRLSSLFHCESLLVFYRNVEEIVRSIASRRVSSVRSPFWRAREARFITGQARLPSTAGSTSSTRSDGLSRSTSTR